jgi:hypothetical protein
LKERRSNHETTLSSAKFRKASKVSKGEPPRRFGASKLPKVKVGDTDVYYEVHGDGIPLVMIMGLSPNIDWWDPRLIQETSKTATPRLVPAAS